MTAIPARREKASTTEGSRVGDPLIVVGVDGSAPSWDAFAWAAGEALRAHGRIVAVFATSIIQPGEALGAVPLGYAAATDARDEMAEKLAEKSPGVPRHSVSK